MRQIIISAFLFLCCNAAISQGVTSENKEMARSTFLSYRSAEDAQLNDRTQSQNFIDLNGEWFYQWFDDATKIPESIFATTTPLDKLKKIALPKPNELNSMAEAVYSEKAYPFLKTAPKDEFENDNKSAVVLVRDISIPFDYIDKAVFLHIGAAKSALTLYVNGKRVGYSTDSRNPAEFDISKFVVRGRNRVALKINRYCAGSFLEDQSEWRLSGVNRNIFVFAQPKIRVRDYVVRTTLDPTYTNGLLETALLLKTQLVNQHKVTVYYDLYDPQGKLVNQANREVQLGLRTEDTVRFTATILNVKQWNTETPNLYTILYRIKREGRWTEYVSVKTGFRTVEIAKGELLINGKAVKFKGVNLAEYSPKTGNVQSATELSKLLMDIKMAGFNAIRTDGYPLSSEFYDLCDQIGLYVYDVANINAQGVGTSIYKGRTLANDPAWEADFLYRVNNTYERSKAHTSVIMWGLGDNAGNGSNMYEAYLMLKAKEQTRPVVYNGGGLEFNSDVFCPSNGSIEIYNKVKGYMDGQPVVFSSCKFDPAIWQTKGIQGGFLERWVSPSISANAKFARLSDEYKLTPQSNGAVTLPSVQDDMAAISGLFKPVKVSALDLRKGIFEFTNNLDFSNLDQLEITCQVNQGGKTKRNYLLNVTAAPGEKITVTVPKYSYSSKDEVVIRIKNIAEFRF